MTTINNHAYLGCWMSFYWLRPPEVTNTIIKETLSISISKKSAIVKLQFFKGMIESVLMGFTKHPASTRL